MTRPPRVNLGPCKEGCGRPSRKVGYCDNCYQRVKKTGVLLPVYSKETLPEFVPNREELAWCAGFIDGEGSFMLANNMPLLSIPQSGDAAPVILQRCAKALGLGGKVELHNKKVRPTHLQAYRLRITGFERTQAAIVRLWPWLSDPKREQAVRVLKRYHEYWMPPGARRRLNNELRKGTR